MHMLMLVSYLMLVFVFRHTLFTGNPNDTAHNKSAIIVHILSGINYITPIQKRNYYNSNEFFVTGCTRRCQNDNYQCIQ